MKLSFNNKRIIILLAGLLPFLCFTACSERSYYRADSEIEMGDPLVMTLRDSMVVPVGQVFGARQLVCAGPYLVVTSASEEAIFHVFDSRTEGWCSPFGKKGRGPNDFGLAYTIKQTWNDNTGCFIAIQDQSELSSVNVTASIENGYPVKAKLVRLQNSWGDYGTLYNETAVIDQDELFVRVGPRFKDARDGMNYPPAFIHRVGEKDYDFNIFPALLEDPVYKSLDNFIYEGAFRISPDKKKAFYSMCLFDEIVIFDLLSDKSRRIIGVSPFPFKEMRKKTLDDLVNNCIMFCIDASVSNDLIAVLYDGRTVVETQQGKASCSYVRFFDWDGDIKGEIRLDHYYSQIALNDNNEELYLLDGEDNIYRLNLHAVF